MDVNVINAFLTAGIDVFQHMFGIECTHNEPYLMDIKIGHQWEVSGLLGITGECKGVVAFRLHKNLSKKMLERSGIYCKPEEADDMACDIVSEFTNTISGNAISKIKDKDLDISPPLTISGPNHNISWPKTYPVIAIPFSTPFGPFEVDVCFK